MNRTRHATALLLTAVLALLAGCREYRAEVEIRPDGSGTRTVTFEPQFDESLTGEDLPGIFGLSEAAGWIETDDGPDEPRFVRETAARDADAWAALGGDVRVYSHGDGDPARGLVNEISLETGRTDEGRTYTYRERLVWRGLKGELIDLMTAAYESRVRRVAPGLPEAAVGELRALFRVHLARTWKTVGLTDDQDRFVGEVVRALDGDVRELVERRRLEVDPELLLAQVAAVVEDEDHELEERLDGDMSGVAAAIFASFELSVAMPGEIIDTNGEIDDSGAATWRLGLLDPVDRAYVLHVRSLVRD